MRTLFLLALAAVFAIGALHTTVVHLVHARVYERELTFEETAPAEVLDSVDAEGSADPPIRPFAEIDAFDDEAWCWSNPDSQYGAAGALVFDANGDGRPDLYFAQDGQNWTRPTDERGVLADEPRRQRNGLYLNQGNDADGNPVFAPVWELVRANDTHVAEELLVEDYLYPRPAAHASTRRLGRSSNTAVAADFDNDGRLDLLIGNEPQGMYWSHPKTQRVLMQFVDPVGREATKSKQPLASLGTRLIDYEPRHSLHDLRASARGTELEGANSLYLNLGDADGDGVPEWRDASREAGLEGRRATYALAVADIDLDGDLDVFEGNAADMDYWIGGSQYWAGGANQLYVNQLAQTGELRFVERAAHMDVDGVYDEQYPMPEYYRLWEIPLLPREYSVWLGRYVPYRPEILSIDGQEGERGQITWSAVFQDVDRDGYPDLWAANDMGYLRLYRNQAGTQFARSDHARSRASGYWMTFAPGDYDGDGREDLFAGNLGGAVMNHAFATPDPFDLFEPVMLNATIFAQFFNDRHSTRHGMIDGRDFTRELANRVRHSPTLPPDVSLPNNYRTHAGPGMKLPPFDPSTLDAYEFAWGSASLDVDSDGRLDLYYLGGLYGRGGGLFPISGTSPGRLLVNDTTSGMLRFVDRTAEYHLFNIEELQYDRLASDGYVYRKSPRLNWGKRDMVYSYDRSSWALHGPGVQERITNQDLIQTAENGRAAVAADLNGDGRVDLVIRNQGGYDSRSSTAVNLRAMVDGQPRVIPPHDHNYPVTTNFEPGRTRLFVNRSTEHHWLRVRLVDDDAGSFNRDAIGATVVVNGALTQTLRSGEGGFLSNRMTPLLFGLGHETATEVVVHWPDRARTVTRHPLNDLRDGTLTLSKTGATSWN